MEDQILALIPLLTPIVVWGFKAVIPRIPKWMLPVLAPCVGALAEIAMHYAGASAEATVLRGAILGASGLWLREAMDQIRKRLAEGKRPATE